MCICGWFGKFGWNASVVEAVLLRADETFELPVRSVGYDSAKSSNGSSWFFYAYINLFLVSLIFKHHNFFAVRVGDTRCGHRFELYVPPCRNKHGATRTTSATRSSRRARHAQHVVRVASWRDTTSGIWALPRICDCKSLAVFRHVLRHMTFYLFFPGFPLIQPNIRCVILYP